jgi:hypothetical protein
LLAVVVGFPPPFFASAFRNCHRSSPIIHQSTSTNKVTGGNTMQANQHSFSQKQKLFNKLICLVVTMNIVAFLISTFLALHSTTAETVDPPKMVSEITCADYSFYLLFPTFLRM